MKSISGKQIIVTLPGLLFINRCCCIKCSPLAFIIFLFVKTLTFAILEGWCDPPNSETENNPPYSQFPAVQNVQNWIMLEVLIMDLKWIYRAQHRTWAGSHQHQRSRTMWVENDYSQNNSRTMWVANEYSSKKIVRKCENVSNKRIFSKK